MAKKIDLLVESLLEIENKYLDKKVMLIVENEVKSSLETKSRVELLLKALQKEMICAFESTKNITKENKGKHRRILGNHISILHNMLETVTRSKKL